MVELEAYGLRMSIGTTLFILKISILYITLFYIAKTLDITIPPSRFISQLLANLVFPLFKFLEQLCSKANGNIVVARAKALHYARDKFAKGHPDLGQFLRRALRCIPQNNTSAKLVTRQRGYMPTVVYLRFHESTNKLNDHV